MRHVAENCAEMLIQATLGHADISTTMWLYVDETAGDSSTKHLT